MNDFNVHIDGSAGSSDFSKITPKTPAAQTKENNGTRRETRQKNKINYNENH